jgi:hypothetical protein
MIHKNLFDYYQEISVITRYHNFDAEYLENLIPFERELHIGMIIKDLEKQKAAREL